MEQLLPSFSLRFGVIVWLLRNFSDSLILLGFPSAVSSPCLLYNVYQSPCATRAHDLTYQAPLLRSLRS